MKKFSKTLALMLVFLTAISALSISGYAVATPLEAGSSMENAANIPEFGVEYVSTLSEAEEVDWFKFTTLSEDAYYHFYFENYSLNNTNTNWDTESPNLFLYDVNMKELEHSFTDGDKTDSFSLKLENNTEYYFKVLMGSKAKNSTGNYQITVSSKLDSAPDSMEKAKPIELNNTVISSFDGYADIDWYSFKTVDVPAEYTITLINYDLPNTNTNWDTDSPNMYLYDDSMQALGDCYTKPSMEGNIDVALDANTTYYLKLFMGKNKKDAIGNYELTVTCDAVTVEPDTPDTPDIPDTPEETVTLSSISVASMPTKTTYAIGEELDTSGLVIKAYYSDGTSATVTNYVLGLFDSSSEGTKTIVVGYSENGVAANCEFTVTVEAEKEEDDGSLFSDIIMIILGFFTVIVDVIASVFSML